MTGSFGAFDPAQLAPLTRWLSEADRQGIGQVFLACSDQVEVIAPRTVAADLRSGGWQGADAIGRALRRRLRPLPSSSEFLPELW